MNGIYYKYIIYPNDNDYRLISPVTKNLFSSKSEIKLVSRLESLDTQRKLNENSFQLW